METTTILDNLVLKEDTVYNCNLVVIGAIIGQSNSRLNLTVKGTLEARDVTVFRLKAKSLNVCNIDAWAINTGDINANVVFCEELNQDPGSKLTAMLVITNRNKFDRTATIPIAAVDIIRLQNEQIGLRVETQAKERSKW